MRRKLIVGLAVCALVGAAAGCDKLGLGSKGDSGVSATPSPSASARFLSFVGTTFEGEITMSTSSSRPMVIAIKSPRVRIDGIDAVARDNPAVGEGAALILDAPQKKGILLDPAKKLAVVLDLDKVKAMGVGSAPAKKPAAPSEPPKIEKTAKKSVIAGYECEEWKLSSKDGRAEVCVAEGLRWIDLGDLGMDTPELALAAAAGDANRFPLRVIAFDRKGVETMRFEATKVEKKPLADAQFVPPPDYRVLDMGALMGAFGMGVPPGLVPPPPPPPKR